MRRTAVIFLVATLPAVAAAQDDSTAGLFTEARQLPLVSQSLRVRILEGEARIELTQVFANDGAAVAQADYRLHLPREAMISAFGFWHDGRFVAAELAERRQAQQAHASAAAAGRPTGLLQRDASIHSFSVFPVPAGSMREVELTITLPVVTERGRSHVRLPLDAFIGHARLISPVVVDIESREPLRGLGVEGARAEERARGKRSAQLVFSAADPVEIWWAAEAPPLLVRAEATPLDDGSLAIQLRLALNRSEGRRDIPMEIHLLVDASASMRRRGRAVRALIERVASQSPAPVKVHAVAESVVEVWEGDATETVHRLFSGEAGFATSWDDLVRAAAAIGCERPAVRCIAVTDPQVTRLPLDRELEAIFLADADELAHFDAVLGDDALIHQPGVDPRAALDALADELVLPVLEVRSIRQDGEVLEPVGGPRLRAAEGGMMRLFLASRSTRDLELRLTIDGEAFERRVEIEVLDADGRLAHALRRGFFRGRLDDWAADYRRSRDPELKRQIIEVSLREGIPTDLTALQVAAPQRVMPPTATPAPLLRIAGLLLLLFGTAILAATARWGPA